MRGISRIVVMLSVAALAAGCGGSAKVVGFTVDGQTGKRMNFFKDDGSQRNLSDDSDNTKQVFTIIDGKFKRAIPCKSGDASEKNKIEADGCYQIDGVSWGQDIPIFAQFDGYERFHGQLTIPSPDSSKGQQTPQILANIRMFPLNYKVDYSIQAHLNGRGLKDTTVMCQIRQGLNSLKTDGHFLEPQNTTSAAIGGLTDDLGVVNLKGKDMVNGAAYHCEAFRGDLVDDRVLAGETDFIAGVSQAEQAIALKSGGAGAVDAAGSIYAVRSNGDNHNDLLGDNAQLIITFNRPVEIVQGTVDCQVARLKEPDTNGNGSVGKFKDTIPGNNESEQVIASLSGDGMVLTLGYRPAEKPLEPTDFGTSVSFAGVYVRGAGTKNDGNQIRVVGGPTGACKAEAGGSSVSAAKPLGNAKTGVQENEIRLF